MLKATLRIIPTSHHNSEHAVRQKGHRRSQGRVVGPAPGRSKGCRGREFAQCFWATPKAALCSLCYLLYSRNRQQSPCQLGGRERERERERRSIPSMPSSLDPAPPPPFRSRPPEVLVLRTPSDPSSRVVL